MHGLGRELVQGAWWGRESVRMWVCCVGVYVWSVICEVVSCAVRQGFGFGCQTRRLLTEAYAFLCTKVCHGALLWCIVSQGARNTRACEIFSSEKVVSLPSNTLYISTAYCRL